jgi:triphosphatase
MVLEQELKLLVNSDKQINLSSLILTDYMIDAQIATAHLLSTYFDTASLYLLSQGLGLRMRKSNEQWVQTVKTSGHVKEGLHQREEWEHQLDSGHWNLDKLKQTPLSEMINDPDIWPSIAPIFTTDFVRKTQQLSLEDGTKIELAYDRGQVIAGKLSTPIHEIELELKSGQVKHLRLLADHLQQQLSLKTSDTSKAKMGYKLMASRLN